MTRPQKLAEQEIARRLAALPGWVVRNGKLHREFTFPDFKAAFQFMTEAAREAESLNHHPEWSNVYNRVAVDLLTHDAQGITALDFELAGKMQALGGAS
jgi:4a-hydroxytetrahydrobiopterin dehydratase